MKKEWSDHDLTSYDTSPAHEIHRDTRGLSPAFQVDAPEGSIAFEIDPPNDAYRLHFHQLKTDWTDGDVVTLEFDGERMQAAGFNILQPRKKIHAPNRLND
ncbi:hypothetical protein OVA29_11920 [Exiguobacterium sp. SL14]|nr:hypothetical protein [Exiguobacterium sp. SL14]MCY1691306.1 hypothetical protein [Exiguobacterium sp. SL14]